MSQAPSAGPAYEEPTTGLAGETRVPGCNVLGLYPGGVNRMLWQSRVKSEDFGRGCGSRKGRDSAEEVTSELRRKGLAQALESIPSQGKSNQPAHAKCL